MRLLIPFLILTFFFIRCDETKYREVIQFTSDLEEFNEDKFVSTSSIELGGAKYQSNSVSRSGEFSVRLDSSINHALDGSIENVKIGDEIHISVWRYSIDKNKGELVVKIGHPIVIKTKKVIQQEGDWELLELDFAIPKEFKGHKLRWNVTYSGKSEVFFDDLSLKLTRNNGLVIKSHPDLPQLKLKISEKGLEKIESKRYLAIENGVLVTNSDDWVKAKVSWDDVTKKGKIRLKGDWTDHLYGQKFSLRVNVSKGKTLGGYSKFGVQNPVSRHYLDEWFIHKILIKENILTTRYEFVDLYINDESKGLYAIEEHFTAELLQSQNKKPGPIFKFSEDELWLSRHNNDRRATPEVSWYQNAIIEAFSQSNFIEDESLKDDFYRGRELMFLYQFKERKASEIVDVKKMAIYLALMDLCNGYHSVIWHNQRFYYNDKKDLLEPLVYDIFQEDSRIKEPPPYFLGLQYVNKPFSFQINSIDFLFQDEEFIRWYIKYLEKFSVADYFDKAAEEMESELAFYEKEINREYDYYSFDLDLYHERAEFVRSKLAQFKKGINSRLEENREAHFGTFKIKQGYEPIKDVSVLAYLNYLPGKTVLQIHNFYYNDLELVGLIINNEDEMLDSSITLAAYLNTRAPYTNEIDITSIPQKVIYKRKDSDSLYIQKVIRYRAPVELR